MQSSVNRKKTSDPYNQLLHSLHFAVCPYGIDLCSQMDSIFTLNFEKDRLIVGQLSTMIYPELDNSHIQLDPIKNIMMFRVHKTLNSDYRWVLYERNQHGKQQMTETVKVNLTDEADKLINHLNKSSMLASSKAKLCDSKSLNNSSKIYQSINSIKASIKATQKGMHLRKSSMLPQNATNSTVSTNQMNDSRQGMKQMRSKFVRSLIEVSYLFCVGFSQDQILQRVKNYHLQSKFSIINKTLKKTDQLLGPQIKTHLPLNNLQLIQEQLELSRKTYNKGSQNDICFKGTQQNNMDPNDQKHEEFPHDTVQKADNKIDEPQLFISQPAQKQQVVLAQQKSNKPLEIQKSSQDIGQIREKDLSELTNRNKTQIHQVDSLDFPQTTQPNQQNTDLSKTQKTHKRIVFNVDLSEDRQLNQTTPTNKINDKNGSKLAPKSITYTDQSNLKLDDVILNGKRISVSDKSEWMITSKSKTSDYDRTQQSNPTTKINPRHKNQIKDIQFANNLQINSRNQQQMSLDLISVNPRQRPSNNQDNPTIQLQNRQNGQKRQDKYENMVKQNSILVIGNRFKLKRKSTAQDFPSNQNRIELTNKPKTMEDATIKKQLKTIQNQLKQGNWIDQDQLLQEETPQITTPMFKNNHSNKQQKFKNLIPFMIDQTVEIRRSGSLSKSNSGQDPQQFDINNDTYDWGRGLSEIHLQQHEQHNKLTLINPYLNKLYSVSYQYSDKYLKPLKQKLQQSPLYQRAQRFMSERFTFITERFKLKHLIVVFVVLLILWISGSSSDHEQRFSRRKKHKNKKQSKRKR